MITALAYCSDSLKVFLQLKISSLDPINIQPARSGLPQIDSEGNQPITPHLSV